MSLSIRQQKYKKNRLLGMNCYNSARAAGFSESTAKKHTKQLEERVKISDMLERKGLTDDVLVAKHRELLEAQSLVIINGEVIYTENGGVRRPEYQIQIKALELAYKLKDLLRDKVEHSGKIEGAETKVIIIHPQPIANQAIPLINDRSVSIVFDGSKEVMPQCP